MSHSDSVGQKLGGWAEWGYLPYFIWWLWLYDGGNGGGWWRLMHCVCVVGPQQLYVDEWVCGIWGIHRLMICSVSLWGACSTRCGALVALGGGRGAVGEQRNEVVDWLSWWCLVGWWLLPLGLKGVSAYVSHAWDGSVVAGICGCIGGIWGG